MRRSLLVIAWVVCLAGVGRADPDPKQTQAEALYTEGSKHYNLREYGEAIDAFKRAYELVPEPTFLFDIAQAYRLLRDCDNAAGFYRNYLRVKPDADDRAKAESLAAEMETCAADQQRERQQRDADQQRLRQTAPPPAAPAGPRYRALRLAGIITAGAGAAFAGAGVYYSLDAADKAHRLEQLCATSCNANDVASIDSAGKSSSDTAVAMYITGGAALAIGGGMILWAALHANPETVTVVPTPRGAAVSTTIHF